jgi:hypothetical protein
VVDALNDTTAKAAVERSTLHVSSLKYRISYVDGTSRRTIDKSSMETRSILLFAQLGRRRRPGPPPLSPPLVNLLDWSIIIRVEDPVLLVRQNSDLLRFVCHPRFDSAGHLLGTRATLSVVVHRSSVVNVVRRVGLDRVNKVTSGLV